MPPIHSLEARLVALLILEGPLTFRKIIAAHEARGWPLDYIRPTMVAMLKANRIGETQDIEYYAK